MPRGNQSQGGSTQQGGNAMNTTTSTPATMKIHSGTTHYKVPPLNDGGEDYTQWSRMMKLVLRQRGLWDVVNGTSTAPNPSDAVAFEIWNNKDQEALLQIILANTDDAKLSVKGITNQVLADEAHRICTSGEHDATAFFAKAKPTSRRNKERQKDENRNNSSTSNSSSASGGSNGSKVCTHCKRRGHKITNCWMLKREKEEKEKANPAMMDSSKTTDMTAKASIARVSNEDIIHLFQASETEGLH